MDRCRPICFTANREMVGFFDLGVETVTTVTVNNNCQTYLPRNRFSRCSAFCFKPLFCVLYLPSADTPHAPPPPPLPLLHPQLEYWAGICEKVLQGTECEGLGLGGAAGERGGGRGREQEGGKRLSGPFISRSAPPPSSSSCSCPSWSPRARGGGPVPRSHATSLSL